MHRQFQAVLGLLAVVVIAASANASVLYVDDDAPPGGDGSSWETAYRFLQDALEAARQPGSAVTEIRVGQGVYVPQYVVGSADEPREWGMVFRLADGVALMGGYAGHGTPLPDLRNPDLFVSELYSTGPGGACCFVDAGSTCEVPDCVSIACGLLTYCCGGGWPLNCTIVAGTYCPFLCHSARVCVAVELASPAILDGFRIVRGRDALENPYVGEGAVFVSECELDIRNCTIDVLHFTVGRAIHADNAVVNVSNCTLLLDNRSTGVEAVNSIVQLSGLNIPYAYRGIDAEYSAITVTGTAFNTSNSAICVDHGNLTISDCLFTGNDVYVPGTVRGNAVEAIGADIDVTDSEFIDLDADSAGAMYLWQQCVATLTNCHFERCNASAIYMYTGEIAMSHCSFVSNPDGAVYVSGLSDFIDCTFENNGYVREGGAVYCSGLRQLVRCRFVNNEALIGGAVYALTLSARIHGCEFVGNRSARGGAMFSYGGFNLGDMITTSDCRFVNNTSTSLTAGALSLEGFATQLVVNCEFIGNSVLHDPDYAGRARGGAVGIRDSTYGLLVNCTMVNNSAVDGGGAVAADSVNPSQFNRGFEMHNCILWNNTADGSVGEDAQIYIEPDQADDVLIANSNIQGWTGALGGFGNIDQDPQFIDIDGADDIPGNEDDDLHLSATSPCIDAGNVNSLPTDEFDVDDDGNTRELYPLDLDGNPRIADVPGMADTGCGAPAVVDMGAYEYPGDWPAKAIPGDISGDGSADIDDVMLLIDAWGGVCDDRCCPEDINADGVVNLFDLLRLLEVWSS